MARLKWGQGSTLYDQGVDHGVLYLSNTAVPWNGLVTVEERPSGALETEHYFDGNRIHISQETGGFEGRILAYTYPDIFSEYNGYTPEETRKRFGFSYRSRQGDHYYLHLIYNVLVRHDDRAWVTDNSSAAPSSFHWDIYGDPVPVPGSSPSVRLTLSSETLAESMEFVENALYGTDSTEPYLPDPADLVEICETRALLRVTHNVDGSYTVTGPDDMVRMLANGRFELDAPSVYSSNPDRFVVSSY